MATVCLKIVGASGQGINAVGEILAKALKRTGYCVFGYREYPSLIKGGHASYHLDVSDEAVASTDRTVHLLLTLHHHGLKHNLKDVREGGVVIHSTPGWKFSKEDEALIAERKLRIVFFPVEELLRKLEAKPLLANVLIASFVWAALGLPMEDLKTLVSERFAKKKDLLELNMRCIEEGYRFTDTQAGPVKLTLPSPKDEWKGQLLLTGSQAMGLGVIRAGVRFFAGYPMTPASPLLSFIAEKQNQIGMAIKQAEDEITAAQMISGAALMGTRALTATSGGGYDLMTETVSLNGLIENPAVFVVAQRPGPATGLPTWTGQADLLMTIYSSHGEFPRCVLAVSDGADAFSLMSEAFNIAEEIQTPVIVLTDKQIAEALYTQAPYDQAMLPTLRRGRIVTEAAALAALKSEDRYDPAAEDGISARWFPGTNAATYCAQGDEHTGSGNTSEDADNARAQMEKRMRKMDKLRNALPEPMLSGRENPDVLLVGWGSTKTAVLDVLRSEQLKGASISYLHYTYLWPLKTERFAELAKKAKKVVMIEGNFESQLGRLLAQESGIKVADHLLKYDGRPFFRDELIERILPLLAAKKTRKPAAPKVSPSVSAHVDPA